MKVWGRLTIVQFDHKRVVDVCQDVSLHLGSHTVSHWRSEHSGSVFMYVTKEFYDKYFIAYVVEIMFFFVVFFFFFAAKKTQRNSLIHNGRGCWSMHRFSEAFCGG